MVLCGTMLNFHFPKSWSECHLLQFSDTAEEAIFNHYSSAGWARCFFEKIAQNVAQSIFVTN
jgi:hypothetical protein